MKRISDEERELFRTAMKGTKPLRQEKTTLPKPPKIKLKRHPPPEKNALEPCDIYKDFDTPTVYSEDALQFARSGLQTRVIQKLRRGEFPIEGELDLHGLTIEQAHARLYAFLSHAVRHYWQAVCIIHGKGLRGSAEAPVLKNKVNQWLRQYSEVLAFCSAKPRLGGAGAVCVLLRRGGRLCRPL